MTYEDFNRLYYINKDIKRLLTERAEKVLRLEELYSKSTSIPGMDLSGLPHGQFNGHSRTEDIIVQIDLLEREIAEIDHDITNQRLRYDKVRRQLKAVIDSCDDERVAMILRYRFLNQKTWLWIAMELGGKNTEDGVRKKCNRYLRKFFSQEL